MYITFEKKKIKTTKYQLYKDSDVMDLQPQVHHQLDIMKYLKHKIEMLTENNSWNTYVWSPSESVNSSVVVSRGFIVPMWTCTKCSDISRSLRSSSRRAAGSGRDELWEHTRLGSHITEAVLDLLHSCGVCSRSWIKAT